MTSTTQGRTADEGDRGADVSDLAEALCRVEVMQRPDFRLTLIQAIGRHLGDALSPADSALFRVHIFNIVTACNDRPGGIAALAKLLPLLAGEDGDVLRFCSLANPAGALVSPEDESRLREPLEQCTMLEVPRLLSDAVEGMVDMDPVPRNAWDAFVRLADTNVRTDGVPPHLAFVALLAALLLREPDDPSARSRAAILQTWVIEQIGNSRAGGAPELAERLQRFRARAAESTGPSLPMTLIIMLEPDLRASGGRYVVTHWRQTNPVRWRPEPAAEELVVGAEDIPRTVASLLRTAERVWAGRFGGALNLELILPDELLNLAADQWPGEDADSALAVPIGTEYEVVLRSQRRLREPGWHRRWILRSQALGARSSAGDGSPVVHRCPPELEGDARRLRLHLNADQTVVAYLLTSPPDREPGRSELAAALRAGLPVVLWCRDPGAQAELWSAVAEQSLHGIPGRVQEIRTDAALGADPALGFGHHISLLWDTFDRFVGLVEPLQNPL